MVECSRLAGCQRLRLRYDRDSERFFAFAMLACARLGYNRLLEVGEAHAPHGHRNSPGPATPPDGRGTAAPAAKHVGDDRAVLLGGMVQRAPVLLTVTSARIQSVSQRPIQDDEELQPSASWSSPPPSRSPAFRTGTTRPQLASCAGQWRMRTPVGADETWRAASVVSRPTSA
jgi:hypothetical protein